MQSVLPHNMHTHTAVVVSENLVEPATCAAPPREPCNKYLFRRNQTTETVAANKPAQPAPVAATESGNPAIVHWGGRPPQTTPPVVPPVAARETPHRRSCHDPTEILQWAYRRLFKHGQPNVAYSSVPELTETVQVSPVGQTYEATGSGSPQQGPVELSAVEIQTAAAATDEEKLSQEQVKINKLIKKDLARPLSHTDFNKTASLYIFEVVRAEGEDGQVDGSSGSGSRRSQTPRSSAWSAAATS